MQNVLQILEASDKMSVPDIKKFALSMIVRDFAQVARLPKMRNLNRHLLIEIIEAMGDVVSELNPQNDLMSSGVHNDIWNLLFSKFWVAGVFLFSIHSIYVFGFSDIDEKYFYKIPTKD